MDLYLDLSPYLNMEEPTLKGRNQRKVLTLSPTLFSGDSPLSIEVGRASFPTIPTYSF